MSLWRPERPIPGDRRKGKTLVLGVDARELAWLGSDGVVMTSASARADGALQVLRDVPRGATIDVVAANDLALHWLQSAPLSVKSLAELQLVAGTRCAHLYGGSPQDWWVAGDWSARHAFACAALPQSVVQPLMAQLSGRGIRVRWHTAWTRLCRARSAAFPSDGWSAIRSPRRVVLWHRRAGRIDCLSILSVDAHATGPDAGARALQQMHLETLRGDGLAPGAVHWLDLTQPAVDPAMPGLRNLTVQLPPLAALGEAAIALRLGLLHEGRG